MISIKDSVLMEVSKPHVMRNLILYPDDTKNFIEGAWTGTKWKEDITLQTPMIRVKCKDYWVQDFAIIDTTSVVRTAYFFIEDNSIKAYGQRALLDSKQNLYVSDEAIVVETDAFVDVIDLVAHPDRLAGGLIQIHQNWMAVPLNSNQIQLCLKVHPLKAIASGKRVINIGLYLFSDETSGSKTKQWNNHESISYRLMNLPFEMSQSEDRVRYLCVSKDVPAMDMLDAVYKEVTATLEKGVVTLDPDEEREVLVVASVFAFLADNPRHSHICRHTGASGNHPCRFCDAKTSVFPSLIGQRRDKRTTLENIKTITERAGRLLRRVVSKKRERGDTTVKDLRDLLKDCNYSSDESRRLLKALAKNKVESVEVKHALEWFVKHESANPPWFETETLDPFRDCPIEILHTILLGLVKYLMRATVYGSSAGTRRQYELAIEDINWKELGRRERPKTLITYVGSCVGRNFKSAIQVLAHQFWMITFCRWRRTFSTERLARWLPYGSRQRNLPKWCIRGELRTLRFTKRD